MKSATTTVVRCIECAKGEVLRARDDAGNPILKCVECQAIFTRNGLGELTRVRSTAPRVTPPSPASTLAPARRETKCQVAGCTAMLIDGACPACAKRAAWEAERRPIKRCEICTNVLPKRAIKFCAACKPVAQRVNISLVKAGAR